MGFQWKDECEASFQKLKDLLTSAPVLALPEKGVAFIVLCDASGVSLGGVLMKKSKANVVADALSCKAHNMGSLAFLKVDERLLSSSRLEVSTSHSILASVEASSTLMNHIRAYQFDYDKLKSIRDKEFRGEAKSTSLDSKGVLRINSHIYVPKYIQDEFHVISYNAVDFGPNLTYEEEWVAIPYGQVYKLRTKEITLEKVQWSGFILSLSHGDGWHGSDAIEQDFGDLRPWLGNFIDRINWSTYGDPSIG
ncbi:uncharacterized protein LOC129884283 [Solanum dulcamara]|uniref:uncharacterized protein LOC129884283 n=1 Tax=Solanum dulcamara TaxID=45834 RepID=UPI0024866CCB|nr:uncharacterized protein LOC129884283 [Solanum dulcamara]